MGLSRILTLALIFSAINLIAAQNSPQDFISPHNSARAEVGVGPMSWNETLVAYADNYAKLRAADCALVHSGGPYGENIFWGSGLEFNAADAVEAWVNEKQYYDYESNSCQSDQQCGHYTQVVWRDSTSVGCARVQCNNEAWFITCNYFPPGNYVGERPY